MQRIESRRMRIGLGGVVGEGVGAGGGGEIEAEGGRRDGQEGGSEGRREQDLRRAGAEVGDDEGGRREDTGECVVESAGKEREEKEGGKEGEREGEKEGGTGRAWGGGDRREREKKSTWSREEAARARRREIEEERLRKFQEKEEKEKEREHRQRLVVAERMETLASKEARLRSQAKQLSRLSAEMQADADQQRQALEARLRAVLQRKERYMQHIVQKAQAASELRHSTETITEATKEPSEPDPAHADAARRVSDKARKETEDVDLRPRKAVRKRMRKFRQRLLSIRSGWHEAVDGEGDDDRHVGGWVSGVGGGKAGGAFGLARGTRLSRLLSDLVKSAPKREDLDEEIVLEKGRGERGAGGRGGGGGGRQSVRDANGMESNLRELLLLLTYSQKERSACGRGREEEAGEDMDRESMLVMVRKSGAIAALTRLLGAATDRHHF